MSKNKSTIAYFIAGLLFLLPLPGTSAITEKDLAQNSREMTELFTKDNPTYRFAITETFGSFIESQRSGARVIDRLAIFLQDCKESKIAITQGRFFYDEISFTLILFMKDATDSQEYLLYLHYDFDRKKKISSLKRVSFSMNFPEKLPSLRLLFGRGTTSAP